VAASTVVLTTQATRRRARNCENVPCRDDAVTRALRDAHRATDDARDEPRETFSEIFFLLTPSGGGADNASIERYR
jgi:hypothetical protein